MIYFSDRRTFCRRTAVSQIGVQSGVKLRLIRFGTENKSLGVTPRQIDVYKASGIAHHHFAKQGTQVMPVERIPRSAAPDVGFPEDFFGFEMPRFQQRQQIIEFQKVVLNGGRRKKEQIAAPERVDKLPVQCRAVLAMMSFVYYNQIPLAGGYMFKMSAPLSHGNGRKNQIVPAPESRPGGCAGNGKLQAELGG